MDRTVLQQMIDAAPGMTKSAEGYVVGEEHRVSIQLGRGGPVMVLADVVRIHLRDAFLEAEAKDRTLHFVPYEPVLALSIRRPRETGF